MVYSVFVTRSADEVEFATSGIAVERALFSGEGVELDATGVDSCELVGTGNDDACTADLETELCTPGELRTVLVSWTLRDTEPGWLNPGRAVELLVAALLVTTGVGEAIDVPD